MRRTPERNWLVKLDTGAAGLILEQLAPTHISMSGRAMARTCHFICGWLCLTQNRPVPIGTTQDRCRFVTAALLEAVRVSKLIDIKPGIERLYRNYEVHKRISCEKQRADNRKRGQ